MGTSPVLITIPISHYCEKARWALDRTGVKYEEKAHLQVIHWVPVARAGGGKTAPVLVWGDRVFADSADIVDIVLYDSFAQAESDHLGVGGHLAERGIERDGAKAAGADEIAIRLEAGGERRRVQLQLNRGAA